MRWFRVWTDILCSPKFHGLSPELKAAWLMIAAAAAKHDREGELPDDDKIAFWLHDSVEHVETWLDSLTKAGFIDRIDGVHVMHDWTEWQSPRACTPAERMRSYRQRKKEKKSLSDSPKIKKDSEEKRIDTDTDYVTGVTHVTPLRNARNADRNSVDSGVTTRNEIVTVRNAQNQSIMLDDPEVDRVSRLAEELSSDPSWGMWVDRMAKVHPIYAVEVAVMRAYHNSDKGKFSQRYAAGILSRFREEGYPNQIANADFPVPASLNGNGVLKVHNPRPLSPTQQRQEEFRASNAAYKKRLIEKTKEAIARGELQHPLRGEMTLEQMDEAGINVPDDYRERQQAYETELEEEHKQWVIQQKQRKLK